MTRIGLTTDQLLADPSLVAVAVQALAALKAEIAELEAQERPLIAVLKQVMALNGDARVTDDFGNVAELSERRTGARYDLVSVARDRPAVLAAAGEAGMLSLADGMLAAFRTNGGAVWADVLWQYRDDGGTTTVLSIVRGVR